MVELCYKKDILNKYSLCSESNSSINKKEYLLEAAEKIDNPEELLEEVHEWITNLGAVWESMSGINKKMNGFHYTFAKATGRFYYRNKQHKLFAKTGKL